MLYDLWILTIRFISLSYAVIAFGAISWIYFFVIKQRDKFEFLRSVSYLVFTLAFIFRLSAQFFGEQNTLTILYVSLIFIGIILNILSLVSEPKPKKPVLPKINSYVLPFIPIILGAIYSMYSLFKKVYSYFSKEYKPLFFAWIAFTLYLVFDGMILSQGSLILSFIATRQELFIFETLQYILLLISSVYMLSWSTKYLSFAPELKLSISVWQLLISVGLGLSAIFTYTTINRTEGQIINLLDRNSDLVDFALQEGQRTNRDLSLMLSDSDEITNGLDSSQIERIIKYIKGILVHNTSVDRITITDPNALLLMDTDNPEKDKLSLSENIYIKDVAVNELKSEGLQISPQITGNYSVSYVISSPVFNEQQEMIGIVSTYKYIDDTYLDVIKANSGQEIILYVKNKRSASTLYDGDSLAKYDNMPLIEGQITSTETEDRKVFGTALIQTNEYITAITSLDKKQDINLFIAIERSPLVQDAKNLIRTTYLGTIAFCLISILPTVIISRKMSESLSA